MFLIHLFIIKNIQKFLFFFEFQYKTISVQIMGKWNKAPPEVSQQFLQNQERRKQMIIQAARRRKQKQKKLQQQADLQKKNQQQAKTRHKQQKKDAYVKYLRNNMHDKYQQMKRNEKASQPQVRSKSKWKKQTLQSNSQLKNQNNLQGLNLQFQMQNKKKNIQNRTYSKVGGHVVRNQPQQQKNNLFNVALQRQLAKQTKRQNNFMKNQQYKQPTQKRRMLQNEFQDLWKQQNQELQQKIIDYDLSVQDQSLMDDLIGSKLLDSLDLDLDTVSRGKKLDKRIKQQKKVLKKQQNQQINDIKNMIGYQSVLISIDQRSQMIKKYNQFMKNQVQKNQIKIEQNIEQNKNNYVKNQNDSKEKNMKKKTVQIKAEKKQKPLNQGEYFNELRNKKQGKILNWANEQAQQADDLFSNCSTNKKSKTRGFQMLKQINKQIQSNNKKVPLPVKSPNTQIPPAQIDIKKKQKTLEIIPQKKLNASKQKLRERSYDKKGNQNNEANKQAGSSTNLNNRSHQIKRSVSQQKINQAVKNRVGRVNSIQNNNNIKKVNSTQYPQRNHNQKSQQKGNKTATNSFKQNRNTEVRRTYNQNQTRPKTQNRRSLSRQKQNYQKSSKQIPSNTAYNNLKSNPVKKQVGNISARQNGVNLPPKLTHLPPTYQRPAYHADQITVCTQDQVFQVQSFIKNQLLALNKQQRQIQQDLKNIHLDNKDKLKQIQNKYQIKTDYKHSYQLKQIEDGQQVDQQIESQCSKGSYNNIHKKQTQAELEESIQRLDDLLLRKQIMLKQKNSRITEEDNQSSSTSRSVINPMCDPISLHKQVLQLAQNLSRFQGQPQQIQVGYGAKLRMKKHSVEKEKSVITTTKKSQISKGTSRVQQNRNFKKNTEIDLSQSQDVNYSQLNSNLNTAKQSKVSRPPQLEYIQYNPNIPADINASDLLDDELEDSIQKGKIQVNQKLRRMLLQ